MGPPGSHFPQLCTEQQRSTTLQPWEERLGIFENQGSNGKAENTASEFGTKMVTIGSQASFSLILKNRDGGHLIAFLQNTTPLWLR